MTKVLGFQGAFDLWIYYQRGYKFDISYRLTTFEMGKKGLAKFDGAELVAITFELDVMETFFLPLNYNYYLHAWFLNQVRTDDPKLSAYLHDGQSEKPFTISQLDGEFVTKSKQIQLFKGNKYNLTIACLCESLCKWLAKWLENPPKAMVLSSGSLKIVNIKIELPPKTYSQLLEADIPSERSFSFSFITPTGFRRKGHHLPLPMPSNIFHSYLRRWNDFAPITFDQETFLAWIDEIIFVSNLDIVSVQATVGKRGSVTGFKGFVEFGIDRKVQNNPEFERLLHALVMLAPYCGTGHKTTFGLGQTRYGKIEVKSSEGKESLAPITSVLISSPTERFLKERIAELIDIFLLIKKRQGGDRAKQTALTWATILARRETGDSLQAIAEHLQIPYLTVKSYSKLARRALKETEKKI